MVPLDFANYSSITWKTLSTWKQITLLQKQEKPNAQEESEKVLTTALPQDNVLRMQSPSRSTLDTLHVTPQFQQKSQGKMK